MGSRVHQVTHINSDAQGEAPPLEPAQQLAILAHAEVRDKPHYFKRNPEIIKREAMKMQTRVDQGYNGLDAEGRWAQAMQWKIGANAVLQKGRPQAALIGYLTGVYYLRAGRNCFPYSLAHTLISASEKEADYNTKALEDVPSWLSDPGAVADDSHEGAAELRTSLLLNSAAAALKLDLFACTRAACEAVLATDEANSKALYRLAKAHEGMGDVTAALSVLSGLIKREPQNGDARRQYEALRKERSEAKGQFKNLFGTASSEAGEAGAAASE